MNPTLPYRMQPITFTCVLRDGVLRCLHIDGDVEALIGYFAQDLLAGTPSLEGIFHPDDRDICKEIFSRSPQTQPVSQTFRIIKKGGQVKILRGTHEKQPGSSGDETCIEILLQDPASLRHNLGDSATMTNFIAMMETTDDYIYFKDRNHVFTGASQTLVAITNPSEHWTDLIGTTDYEVFPREFADIYFTLEKKVFSGLLEVAQEIQPTLDVHGNKGWVDNRKYPIKNEDGEIIGLFGIARDVTRLVTAEEIARQAQLSSAIMGSIENAVMTCDAEGRISLCNRASRDMFGMGDATGTIDEWNKKFRLYEGKTSSVVTTESNPLQRALQGETLRNVEFCFEPLHGKVKHLLVSGNALLSAEGKNMGAIVSMHDITALKTTEEQLRQNAERTRRLLRASTVGLWEWNFLTGAVYFSPEWKLLLGYADDEIVHQFDEWQKRVHPEDLVRALTAMDDFRFGRMPTYGIELRMRHRNGTWRWTYSTADLGYDEKGDPVTMMGSHIDINDRKADQLKLEHDAHYDALTHLPNRVLMADRLQQAMSQCQRHGKMLAVACLDIDGFKAINDTHGHNVGDQVLIELAQRIKDALREGDTLSRLGGDEFVVILADLGLPQDCEPVLQRLLEAAASEIPTDAAMLKVSASMGVTLFPHDDVDADQLLRHADQAMYVAKREGKNRYRMFDVAQDSAIKKHRVGLESIRSAIDQDEFILHYQPKVNVRTGAVVGTEALIRWQHPQRGLLAPGLFLPLIEGQQISVELGEWVIRTALQQISIWRAAGLQMAVSVNVGALQLQGGEFVAKLTTALAAHPEMPRGLLEMEIVETSALEDVAQVSQLMHDCIALGVGFALDDFGTGYSSLTYLKRLPVRLLKIDQGFVRDMLSNQDDLAIVQGVIGLARVFKREVIAEGVETEAHAMKLLELGCELAQGYGIARPMPAAEFSEWVESWHAKPVWSDQLGVNNSQSPLP